MVAGAKTIFFIGLGYFMAISNVCSNPKGKGSGFESRCQRLVIFPTYFGDLPRVE